ncbi:MAG: tautomerase family protein [Acidimicrobiales bacterium]
MPFIQIDIREGLTPEQLAQLRSRVVDTVHDAIGSARAHINLAVHELPAGHLVEAGDTA